MVRVRVSDINPLGALVVESLLVELATRLFEVTDVPWYKIIRNYKRRVRRGNPGLTEDYVIEEAIRRMAQEAALYSAHYRPGDLIEHIEREFRKHLWYSEHADVLRIWEYHFPLNEHSVFASRKYPVDSVPE